MVLEEPTTIAAWPWTCREVRVSEEVDTAMVLRDSFLCQRSIILALSIDYALFLLTRFSEEIKGGSSMSTAVREMLLHSGHTICGSGFTLALCFLVLLLFPVQMIQSIGVGVVISILSCMAVNLTLIPALLFECPGFFSEFAYCGLRCSKRNDLRSLRVQYCLCSVRNAD